jgi:hypothetical protein
MKQVESITSVRVNTLITKINTFLRENKQKNARVVGVMSSPSRYIAVIQIDVED